MNRLKELRIKKGVYQKDVAQFLGVDRTTYVKYENGDSEPSNEILKLLSKYFNVSIDYILDNSSKSEISFGSRLKELRISKNLTQEDLAKKINLSKANISKYEADLVEPSLETLSLLAKLFDVSTNYLLCVPESDSNANKNNFSLRTPEEEQELNEYLEAVRTNPELRMMFSLTKNAKKEDVEKAVQIIKTLLGK